MPTVSPFFFLLFNFFFFGGMFDMQTLSRKEPTSTRSAASAASAEDYDAGDSSSDAEMFVSFEDEGASRGFSTTPIPGRLGSIHTEQSHSMAAATVPAPSTPHVAAVPGVSTPRSTPKLDTKPNGNANGFEDGQEVFVDNVGRIGLLNIPATISTSSSRRSNPMFTVEVRLRFLVSHLF